MKDEKYQLRPARDSFLVQSKIILLLYREAQREREREIEGDRGFLPGLTWQFTSVTS
jgi:hypothetical protein